MSVFVCGTGSHIEVCVSVFDKFILNNLAIKTFHCTPSSVILGVKIVDLKRKLKMEKKTAKNINKRFFESREGGVYKLLTSTQSVFAKSSSSPF